MIESYSWYGWRLPLRALHQCRSPRLAWPLGLAAQAAAHVEASLGGTGVAARGVVVARFAADDAAALSLAPALPVQLFAQPLPSER
jgi:hypothetical protein